MWAPMYRQVTLAGILDPANVSALGRATPTRRVRAAFDDYIKHDNHGRGFVLIGHSQGSFVLKQLISDEIDKRPALRQRMVSALLLGGNVTNKEYKHVKPCSKPGQNGLRRRVVDVPRPAAGRLRSFGRTTPRASTSSARARAGSAAPRKLVPYAPTLPFPGTIGAALSIFEPNQPDRRQTPWYAEPGG